MKRLLISALLLAGSAGASCLRDRSFVVKEFTFDRGSRVEAALALASEAGLCLEMRNLPRSAFLEPIKLDILNENVMEILRQIFSGEGVQIFASETGLIKIRRPSGSEAPSLFDRTIIDFSFRRAPLQNVSEGLKIHLKLELHPEIQGYAGHFAIGDQSDLVGPFNEHGRTVSQLLDLFVSSSKGASWVALVPDSAATGSMPEHMWAVVQYDKPISDYGALFRQAGSDYPAGETTN